MSEAPLFERIPPKAKTYDELVELNHYLNKRCSMVEGRLYELTLAIRREDMDDDGSPYRGWCFCLDMLKDWDVEDGYEWVDSEHFKTPVEMYYQRDDQ